MAISGIKLSTVGDSSFNLHRNRLIEVLSLTNSRLLMVVELSRVRLLVLISFIWLNVVSQDTLVCGMVTSKSMMAFMFGNSSFAL